MAPVISEGAFKSVAFTASAGGPRCRILSPQRWGIWIQFRGAWVAWVGLPLWRVTLEAEDHWGAFLVGWGREADILVGVQGRECGGGNQCKLPASFHHGWCSTRGGKACFLPPSKQGQRSFGGYFEGCFGELSLKVFLCGVWRSVPH